MSLWNVYSTLGLLETVEARTAEEACRIAAGHFQVHVLNCWAVYAGESCTSAD